jgi:hypothetical protein
MLLVRDIRWWQLNVNIVRGTTCARRKHIDAKHYSHTASLVNQQSQQQLPSNQNRKLAWRNLQALPVHRVANHRLSLK